MTREQILKKGGFANTPEGIKAFYKKYNTPEKFFAEHGGSLSGAPHDGQPTADQFFNYGAPALGHMNIPMSNPTYLAHGGYMDMGGYNSPTNYGSFSVPMAEGGYYEPGGSNDLVDWAAKQQQMLQQRTNVGIPTNVKKYFGAFDEPRKFDSTHVYPGNPNIEMGFKGNKVMLISKDSDAENTVRKVNKPRTVAGPIVKGERDVYFDYLNPHEYGGILDASNNQDYPMMDEGGMESMSKGNIIKMLKQAARQRKKAYREGGNTSMQGGNANNIPQQITDNFINGVSNLYNNHMIDQKTEYVANQINAMDQEMMPMANMGMQSYDMSPQIGQYQNYISNLENQNQSAFGNMLNSATNLAATLPRGSQNPFAGAPTVSDITKASEPVKAQAGINKMPKFALTDKSQEVNKGIQDINRARAEEEQRKSYANQTDDVKHLTNEDIKRLQAEQERSYQNWNNTYNSGSQNPNKPWWEQPYRFGFNDPRGFAGMFPDTYYKTSTEGSRTLKEAKDRNLPFTSMEATYGAGAKAAANISKLIGKDPNKTLTRFSPKKIRYYFGQGAGQGAGQGTKQPATADTPAATNSLYNPMTAEQAANPYGQIPEGTTQAPAPYLPASVAPGYDASGRLLNPPQSLPGTNLFNMNAQLKEYTGNPLNEGIKQSRVEELMNPFSADAQRQLDIMRGPYTGKAPGVFYNQADQPPYGFEQDVMSNQLPTMASEQFNTSSNQSPLRFNQSMMDAMNNSKPGDNYIQTMRKAYGGDYFGQYYNGGIPMAQWGFANPVDMTMLGISNTKPELYVDAKRKRDYSAAAPFASGFISNIAQGINIPKNQEAIAEAQSIAYNPAGRYAQATTGTKGPEEINTQAYMSDKSMDSPYQTSAYSVRGEYGGSFDEGGAYEEGKEYDVTDEQIKALENAGYILKY